MSDRDLDDLFERSSRSVRPSARFEEELLVRIESEFDATQGERGGSRSGEETSFELAAVEGEAKRSTAPPGSARRWVAVAAAVLLLVGGTALIVFTRNDGTQPSVATVVDPGVDAELLDGVNDVCQRLLPDVQAIFPTLNAIPGGPSGGDVTLTIRPLRLVVDGFAIALESAPPALGALRNEVARIDALLADQELLMASGQDDSVRSALPIIAERLIAVAAALGEAGAVECESAASGEGP